MPSWAIWASEGELARWRVAAAGRGLSFNAWLRQAAEDRARFDSAQAESAADAVRDRERLLAASFPQRGGG